LLDNGKSAITNPFAIANKGLAIIAALTSKAVFKNCFLSIFKFTHCLFNFNQPTMYKKWNSIFAKISLIS
jgi:hypothetical protein